MVPNSYVLINDGVNDSIAADAEACEIKPTWNAAVCKGDVGRLNIGGPAAVDSAASEAWIRRRRSWRRCRSWRWSGGRWRCWRSWRRSRLAPVPVLAQPAVLVAAAGGRRRPGGPAQPPVVLSRNGKDYNRNAAPTYEPVPRSR